MIKRSQKGEHILKLCTLSHPDELAYHFVKRLIEDYSGSSTEFEALGVSISTIKIQLGNTNRVKVILIRTDGDRFLHKLGSYYQDTGGAIILFSKDKPDSFRKASLFFQSYKKLVEQPLVPIIFVDLRDKSEEILNTEPEESEDGSSLYYEVNIDDTQAFDNILRNLANIFLDKLST
jgi:hypothetical protein